MQYQSDGTQVNTRPAPAAVNGTPGWVTGGNPAAGIAASDDDPDVMNQIFDELVGLVVAAGITPSKTDSTQVLAAIRALIAAAVAAGAYVPPAGVVVLNDFSAVYSYTAPTAASYFVHIDPDGFMEQGGQTTGSNAAGQVFVSVTFPVPFPSGQAPIIDLTLSDLAGSAAGESYISSRSATGFTAVLAAQYGFYWSARWH